MADDVLGEHSFAEPFFERWGIPVVSIKLDAMITLEFERITGRPCRKLI
jgi:hypothetical protein